APRTPEGKAPVRSAAPPGQWATSGLHDAVDLGLRLVERFLRLLLADERRLYRGRQRVADRRPLRHARAPVDVGVLLERLQRGFDEVGAAVAHEAVELRVAPERAAVDARALRRPGELPRGARLRLGGRGPRDEEPGGALRL